VDEAASHIKELVDPDANIIWGSAFNNALDGKIRVSVVATGIEAEAATSAEPARVFAFPTARKSDEIIRTPEPVIAPAPVPEPEPVAIAPAYEPEPIEIAEVASPNEEAAIAEAPLTLDPPEPVPSMSFDDAGEDGDELVLDTQSMLDDPVVSNPLPPVAAETVEEDAPPRRRWLVSGDAEEAAPAPKAPASGATLFERMSNIARSAARGDADAPEPSDPLDIPRFLNRQNNQ
jgi:cell division protein FtsZ